MNEIQSTLKLVTWDETVAIHHDDGESGARISLVTASFQYTGGLSGESQMQLTLQYNSDGSGVFSGWERFSGEVAGKSGALMFKQEGSFSQDGVRYELSTVPGSGKAGLENMQLGGRVDMLGHGPYEIRLMLLDS